MRYIPGFIFLVGGSLPRMEGHKSASILERKMGQPMVTNDPLFLRGKVYKLQNIQYKKIKYIYTFLDTQEKRNFDIDFTTPLDADMRIARLIGDTLPSTIINN